MRFSIEVFIVCGRRVGRYSENINKYACVLCVSLTIRPRVLFSNTPARAQCLYKKPRPRHYRSSSLADSISRSLICTTRTRLALFLSHFLRVFLPGPNRSNKYKTEEFTLPTNQSPINYGTE